MAFPTNPTDGEQANINGVVYTYSSSLTAWQVTTTFSGNITVNQIDANAVTSVGTINSANITGTNLTVTGNVLSPFYTSSRTIVSDTSISANTNAMSAGPIIINDGVVVTIETGAEWSVV